ncbi:ABC transporter C family member 2-like [Cucumis melo var. makuwa]|uniref:ABC transporter C family member 2-like n=1 Tax=Cucumis melo var. makuwa TaxID=1194695 RepID=A0A5D3DBT5_CUCMM|nr:ABC transporter C family member 2-like [Cucumis melo var. makuwa]
MFQALTWGSMLGMLLVKTKVYIFQFRWAIRLGVVYISVAKALFGVLLLAYFPSLDVLCKGGTDVITYELVDGLENEELVQGEHLCPERHANLIYSSDSAVGDPTYTKGRSNICYQIYRLVGSIGHLRFASSSAIQLLLREDRAFAIRSTVLVGVIGHLRNEKLDIFVVLTVNDPTSTADDQTFTVKSIVLVGVIRYLCCASPSTIQLLLGDDRAFAVKSTVLVGAIRHLYRASSLLIQLLLEDDRVFTVRSIVLVGAIRHLHRAFDPTSIGDGWAFAIKSIVLVGAIEHLCRTSSSAIQLLRGDDWTFAIRSIALIGAIRHLRCASPSEIELLLGDDRHYKKLRRSSVGGRQFRYFSIIVTPTPRRRAQSRLLKLECYVAANWRISMMITPGVEKPISLHVVRFSQAIGLFVLDFNDQVMNRFVNIRCLTPLKSFGATVVVGQSRFYNDSTSSLSKEWSQSTVWSCSSKYTFETEHLCHRQRRMHIIRCYNSNPNLPQCWVDDWTTHKALVGDLSPRPTRRAVRAVPRPHVCSP